ncbi:MAG: tRNA pseudouridine synthase Pus10 [Methanonatronarchaeales archaeon]|nr:tRNA pseudouridine synthase Pus10 [Methanonatronarchaeales archaeon]
METLQSAREMLEQSPLCDHCLGRQFAMLLTGTTNDARGRALKRSLGAQGHVELRGGDPSLLEAVAASGEPLSEKVLEREGVTVEEEVCTLCGGLFTNLDRWADLAESELSGYGFDTFLVGTRTPGDLVRREEAFWTEHGARHAEPLKGELNREVGRRLEERSGARADLKNPDVVALLDPEEQAVEVQSNPLYVYGRYRKLVRGIPQTEWPCHVCGGEGCMRCDGTGMLYETSVEGLVSPPFVEAAGGTASVFHGCGREDVDALMLGAGRPFVLEVKEPSRRDLDLEGLETLVNDGAEGRVEVSRLAFAESGSVEEVKSARPDKTYRVRVRGDFSEEKLKEALSRIRGEIVQQTPTRVSHRRAERARERTVKETRLMGLENGEAVVEIRGEAGLYVKELVHGDSGRTEPSLRGLVGSEVECVELDVTGVEYERDINGQKV